MHVYLLFAVYSCNSFFGISFILVCCYSCFIGLSLLLVLLLTGSLVSHAFLNESGKLFSYIFRAAASKLKGKTSNKNKTNNEKVK